jgi:hypothetical protein
MAEQLQNPLPGIKKIVSGGQTGVDRAGLDAARNLGLPIGGWCPKSRVAEDGCVPDIYPLIETPTEDYAERTLWNVRDADATLIITHGMPKSGTAMTRDFAMQLSKPLFIVDLDLGCKPETVAVWLKSHAVNILNIAGPRESLFPGIYDQAKEFLLRVLG